MRMGFPCCEPPPSITCLCCGVLSACPGVTPIRVCHCVHVPHMRLQVGKKFDLQLLLHKVDLYLESRVLDMETSKNTYASSWGWFKRADRAGLTVCLPAIATRIRKQGKATCKSDKHLRSLSAAACRVLVKELAS